MLLGHFTNGTRGTKTGERIGCEIETDFVDIASEAPIDQFVSRAILACSDGRPDYCRHMPELGRQKIELAIKPARTFEELRERAHVSLGWLYGVAAHYGARPLLAPEIQWPGSLLDESTDPRNQVWVQLDGRPALEQLCRCSSVQFTVDVNPGDAISVINALWEARLHELDYEPNHRRWLRYIKNSQARYISSRYAGPNGFDELADYVAHLVQHKVVMHDRQPTRISVDDLPDLDAELFLRSVWWHYRLRRHYDTLAIEVRPFARRDDDCIEQCWSHVAPVFGL
jgi:hypothetical protein